MKKIILKIILLSIYLKPLFSIDPKLQTLKNLFDKYKEMSNDPNTGSIQLMQKFADADLPADYAMNMITGTYEKKQPTQSNYMTLDKSLPAFFDGNKVNCLNLGAFVDEIKKQSGVVIKNPDDIYKIIWTNSCLTPGKSLETQTAKEAPAKIDLINEINKQSLPVYNKLVKDAQGNPVLKDNKPQYVYDQTIKSISTNKKEIKVGPLNNQITLSVVENFELLDLDKLAKYLNEPDSGTDYKDKSSEIWIVAGAAGGVLGAVVLTQLVKGAQKGFAKLKAYISNARASEGLSSIEVQEEFIKTFKMEGFYNEKGLLELQKSIDLEKFIKNAGAIEDVSKIMDFAAKDPELFESIAKMAKSGSWTEEGIKGLLVRGGVVEEDAAIVARDLMKVAK